MSKDIDFEQSSGNVFADLGVPEPEEALLKSDLAIRISQLIEERGLTQKEAAALLHITQPYVSKLMRGQLRGFSVERLLRFLVMLGQEIDVVIRPKTQPTRSPGVRTVFTGPSPAKV
jgi:predicted XRE-type DNA-binding protein